MDHRSTRLPAPVAQRSGRALAVAYILLLAVSFNLQPEAAARAQGGISGAATSQATTTPASATTLATTGGPVAAVLSALPLRFRHITAEQGLSSQRITAILQDQDGFMWFATTNGLDRYDGYSVVAYRNDPEDPYSLGGNYINALIEDKSGKLWAATTTGLSSLDRATGRFTRYLNDPADPQSLSDNTVQAVYEDRSGVLWVGTNSGLDSLDRATGRFTHYLNDPDDPQSISGNRILVIYEDRAGMLWIGTDRGLSSLDRATGRFTRYMNDPANPRSLSYDMVWDIYEDRAGTLWLTTDGGGLNRLDPARGDFDHFRHDPSNPNSLAADRLDCLFEDPSGALWVGTFGGGLSILDPSRRTFSNYQNNPSRSSSLSNNSVTTIYADRSGVIWLGTIGGGVEVYNPQQEAFAIYRNDPNTTTSIASDSVYSVYEDRDGVVWVGTRDAGLDRFVPEGNADGHGLAMGGEFVHYPPDPSNLQSLGFPFVRASLQDRTGNLWIGTYGDGLYRLDPATGIFTPYRYDPANPNGLSDGRIWGMVEDDSGQMWIATFGGLDRFDPTSGSFTSFRNDPSNPNSVSSNFIWSIAKDQSGNIWIGTRGAGLNRIEPATGKITRYQHDPNNPASLANDGVDAVLVDRSGVLWVGMFGGGLDRFNPADNTFTHFRERDGLASDEVLAIVEDAAPGPAGNLWIVSGLELSRLDQDRKTFRTYGTDDGLPLTQYTGAAYATRGGELLVGSERGLIAFDPAALRDDPYVPPVAFTDFLLENKPVPIAATSPLAQSINKTGTIELSYLDQVISFEFSALSYSAPARNRYRYKLDGFDADWTEVDSTHRLVTYTNLNPGRYTFRVTASNGDGVWNQEGRAITLLITPPWWEMLWFRALLVLAAIGVMLLAYRARVSSLERQHRTLEVGIAERTADLAQANSALESEIVEREETEVALQHANVQLQQRVGELSALNQITQTLTQGTDVHTALEATGGKISDLFNRASIGIWAVDEPRHFLTNLIIVAGEQVTSSTHELSLDSDPVSNEVVSLARTKVLSPSDPHPAITQPPYVPVDAGGGGTMLLPLQSRSAVIGLLCISAAAPGQAFTQTDVALAQTISGTLANAIENARLFTEAQIAAAEEERRRLTRDLHDSVSQALFAANMAAEVLPTLWELDPEKGRRALGDMLRFTQSAQAEMRMLLVELRPKALIETPLHDLLNTLHMAVSAKSQAQIDAQFDRAPHLPPDVQIALYRLAQEALTNVLKHSDARHVSVSLKVSPAAPDQSSKAIWRGKVALRISDDGRGFDVSQASQGRFGLETMRERAAAIVATLRITSKPEKGTQVDATWIGRAVPRDAPVA